MGARHDHQKQCIECLMTLSENETAGVEFSKHEKWLR